MSRPIATSTLWQLLSQITMAALSIVTTKIVAVTLHQELFGLYNTAYGYLQVFGILADFGLYAVAVREVSRFKEQREQSEMLGALFMLRSLILAVSLSAALVIAWLIPHWQGTPLPLGITVAAFVPAFTLLSGVLRTSFQVHYRMHWVFMAEVSQRVLTVSLIALIAYHAVQGTMNVNIYLSMLGVGGLGAVLLFIVSLIGSRKLIPLRFTWNPELLKKLFWQITPYGLAFLCMALYRQLDVTFIGVLRLDHATQNAYYGAVQRMMDMAYLLPTFLLNSALPILTERQTQKIDTAPLVGSLALSAGVIGGISFLFSTVWARPLVSLLTNEQYLSTATSAGSDTALHLLAIPMLCNAGIVLAFYMLLATHGWQVLVKTLSVGVVVSLLMNVLLIPRFGFVGAGMTSIVVHTLLLTLLLPQAYWRLPWTIREEQWRAVGWFFAGLFGFLIITRPFLQTDLRTAAALAIAGFWLLGLGYMLKLHVLLRTK
jgi:O-antigen/teichoic acid export membrane protein